jgi:hypothetical protein
MKLDVDTKGDILVVKRLQTGSKKVVKRAVFLVMNKMETLAKQNINLAVYSTTAGKYKRSGKAQQSIIGQQTSDTSARVYGGVNYLKYIEEGTGIYHEPDARKPYFTTFGGLLQNPIYYKGMKARPFWAPAIKETRNETPSLIKKAVQDVKL